MSNVQQIIDGCSQDIRKILNSGDAGDQVALIDYTNRTQLQLLRASRWRFLLSGVLQFKTVTGVTDYWIGASGAAPSTTYTLSAAAPDPNGNTNTVYTGTALGSLLTGYPVTVTGFVNAANNGAFEVVSSSSTTVTVNNANGVAETHAGSLQITMPDTGLNITNLGVVKPGTVFDRTNFRRLYPTDEAPLGPGFASSNRPGLYRSDISTPGILSIYPPAQGGYAIEFRYFFAKPQLAALNDTLLIIDDYKDVVIAGVNYLANLYLRENYEDAQIWKAIFEEGIAGMHRDHNLFPRGQEFISPDPASQPRNFITPIGLDSGVETSMP